MALYNYASWRVTRRRALVPLHQIVKVVVTFVLAIAASVVMILIMRPTGGVFVFQLTGPIVAVVLGWIAAMRMKRRAEHNFEKAFAGWSEAWQQLAAMLEDVSEHPMAMKAATHIKMSRAQIKRVGAEVMYTQGTDKFKTGDVKTATRGLRNWTTVLQLDIASLSDAVKPQS